MAKKIFVFILICVFISPLFPAKPAEAAGATLFLSPSSGTFGVNATITVKVMVDSGGGAGINAAEGSIKFDPAYLSVSSLSNSGSIFTLWTSNGGQGPGFSNTAGTITFGGGSPSAYKGNAGTIFTIVFKAKKEGTADANFTNGIVLAADGKGTDIYSGSSNAKFTIEKKEPEKTDEPKTEEPKAEEPKPKGILPPMPEVSSDSHSDENVWYANNSPEFSWKILPDLTSISFEITSDPSTDPKGTGEGVVESKKFDKVEDGVWYFHLKYMNKVGWGQVGRKKFMIDSTPPEAFGISLDTGSDKTNPAPKLLFSTVDKTSGIDFYTISVGSDSKRIGTDQVKDGGFKLDPLAPGEYSVNIAATDKAGNTASSSVSFVIDPLKAPIISDIPKSISGKDELVVRGESFYPNVTVKIFMSKSEKETIEESVQTDENGNWAMFYKKGLPKGNYEIWAKIVDKRGAQSLNSTKYLLSVVSPSIIDLYGLYIILALILIIILLFIYIWYLKKQSESDKQRIKRETEEMKSRMGKIFAALREEVDELVETADKKPGFSETERKIKERLQESLDISEEFINKEVDDVEKEIKLKRE